MQAAARTAAIMKQFKKNYKGKIITVTSLASWDAFMKSMRSTRTDL
jgi:short-subunit dehydrogenase